MRGHASKMWTFPEIDHLLDCDCPRTPCGGTYLADWYDSECDQHNVTRTIRNMHSEDRCPGGDIT